jgi:hypothetical protein
MNEDVIKKLKAAINACSGKNSHEIIEYLRFEPDLDDSEKNLVFTWFTSHILQDGDLPRRLQEYRSMKNKYAGFLEPELGEISILLGAYQSPQYKRYLKHMLMAYNDAKAIYPVQGNRENECGICKKAIYNYNNWENRCKSNPELGEQERKEYLEFASPTTNVSICLDCLMQLKGLHEFLVAMCPEYWKYKNTRKIQ